MSPPHPNRSGSPIRLSLLPQRLGLPRGRSALPESEVAASQRGRILQAVTEVVAEEGYAATTVALVIARARVSRTAFYALFGDKEDAFAQAHLAASEQLFDLIHDSVGAHAGADWRTRHRAAVAAYLDGFARAPAYATSFMVEIRSAGPRLLDQRDQTLERHTRGVASLAREAHAEDPDAVPPSRLALIGAVGAGDELATREIRAGRFDDLSALLDPIVEIHRAVIRGGPARA